jgi:hypothetical protein
VIQAFLPVLLSKTADPKKVRRFLLRSWWLAEVLQVRCISSFFRVGCWCFHDESAALLENNEINNFQVVKAVAGALTTAPPARVKEVKAR